MPLSLSRTAQEISPSVTLSINTRAKEMRAAGARVIGFAAGEPDFNTPDYICDAAREALASGMTRYTPVPGTMELRERIVKKLKDDNSLTYEPADIVVSNGAKQSLYNALSAIVNPGDEVLLPAPCWVSYPEMVRIAGGVPVFVKTADGSALVSASDLRAAVTPRTKALILNSPNNPNGCVWPENMLREIAELAVSLGFYVISDEIYEKLIYDGQKHVSIASFGSEIQRQTILVNGVSKSYAMTGWRIGYAAATKEIARLMSAFQSHTTSNANSIAQHAAAVALANGTEDIQKMVAAFDRRRLLLHSRLCEIPGLSAELPQGAFYLMLNIEEQIGRRYEGREITGSEPFAELLLESQAVATVPCKAFGSDIHVRLSYATSEDDILEGARRIREFVSALK